MCLASKKPVSKDLYTSCAQEQISLGLALLKQMGALGLDRQRSAPDSLGDTWYLVLTDSYVGKGAGMAHHRLLAGSKIGKAIQRVSNVFPLSKRITVEKS